MRNIKFLKNPGYMLDLFFLFTLHFNKEHCLANFINYSKSSQDTAYFKRLLDDFPPISNELILFFYLTEDQNNFMSSFYFEPYQDKFTDESYTLSFVQNELTDYEQVKENVLKFYFRDIAESDLLECKTSISAINKLIRTSDYNGEIRSALYSFFIEPAAVIRTLSYELMEKEFSLSQKYDNEFKCLSELQQNFDFEFLSHGLQYSKYATANIDGFDNIYVSFCLYNKNCIKMYYYDDTTALGILGLDYIDEINYLTVQNRLPELETFGNAISETNRIGVLDMILQRGEITIKDLEQEFGFTGTNAYYHLSLMIKAGMLKTRNRGRTVLYSINKSYFQILCDMLGKYYKE